MSSVRQLSVRDLVELVEFALFVGMFFVFYLAPLRYLHGESEGWIETIAAIVGLLFWSAGMVSVAQMLA